MKYYAALLITAALMLFDTSAYAAPACANTEEKTAFDTRVLQTELMVGALSCGQNKHYNSFVQKFQSQLTQRGKTLQSYFRKKYGKSSPYHLNKFITKIANDASVRSMRDHSGEFCKNSYDLFQETLALSAKDLTPYVAQNRFSSQHGIPACGSTAASGKAKKQKKKAS